MKFTEEEVRKRFHEVDRLITAQMKKVQPLQDERDAFIAEASKKELALTNKVKKAREGLADLQAEKGMLAKALNGRTGEIVA